MAEILNKDPATYDRERDSFIRDLKHFCEARGYVTEFLEILSLEIYSDDDICKIGYCYPLMVFGI